MARGARRNQSCMARDKGENVAHGALRGPRRRKQRPSARRAKHTPEQGRKAVCVQRKGNPEQGRNDHDGDGVTAPPNRRGLSAGGIARSTRAVGRQARQAPSSLFSLVIRIRRAAADRLVVGKLRGPWRDKGPPRGAENIQPTAQELFGEGPRHSSLCGARVGGTSGELATGPRETAPT
jgi:hypothetical protein